jgi:hypothetical protein
MGWLGGSLVCGYRPRKKDWPYPELDELKLDPPLVPVVPVVRSIPGTDLEKKSLRALVCFAVVYVRSAITDEALTEVPRRLSQ